MDSSVYVVAGSVIVGLLALIGVIWQTRARPEPLSQVVKAQQGEIDRLVKQVTSQQAQIDDLNARLGSVTRLERDKSRLTAGVFLLTNQLVAAGLAPVWVLPDDIASQGDVVGPHRPA